MKFIMALITLMGIAGCSTPDQVSEINAADASNIKIVSTAEWKTISSGKNVVELGCVCEGANSAWVLYRYTSANMDVYKVTLSPVSDLNACIQAKFVPGNCTLKL